MKTSLAHLPESTQVRLREIASLLVVEAPVEMLVLFGSYARTDWVEDAENGYFSDFDLLVVVPPGEADRTTALWASLRERARAIAGPTSVALEIHDIKDVNHEIRLGQSLFIDILRDGIALHDTRRFQLAAPKTLDPRERLALALHNFRYWFGSANAFWASAGNSASRNERPQAAFLLHQAVERYYAAVALVFTGYKPKSHKIDELANQHAPFHPALAAALPRAEGEDARLFSLLRRAYIEARYSKSFRITGDELATLRATVHDLATRVRESCLDRLAQICGPEAVGDLPAVPAITDIGDVPPMPPAEAGGALDAWKEGLVSRGVERGLAEAVLTLLESRGLPLTPESRSKIESTRDPALLKRWIAAAATATSADDLFAPTPGAP